MGIRRRRLLSTSLFVAAAIVALHLCPPGVLPARRRAPPAVERDRPSGAAPSTAASADTDTAQPLHPVHQLPGFAGRAAGRVGPPPPRPPREPLARRLLQLQTATATATVSYSETLSIVAPVGEDDDDENPNYPRVFFSRSQMESGAVVLPMLGIVYLFAALAIVCDDFFVPALEVITERLALSEDVAGATFMAAGGSAPELFTSIMGVFVADSNVGFGTIVGSAVFNILFVIGVCAVATRSLDPLGLPLTWWPLFRDSVFYTIDLALLSWFFEDRSIEWYESLTLLCCYAAYVVFMKFNAAARQCTWEMAGGLRMEELSQELTKMNSSEGENGDGGGDGADGDGDDDDDDDGPWEPKMPDGTALDKFKFVLFFPLNFALWLTVPNCNIEEKKHLFALAFFLSICWIAVFAYFMVWWAEITGDVLGIPSEVMGYTVLAAGTSVPDLITSVLVARLGRGDMAVSSSIGSNIFDITFGLPLPWLLSSIINGGDAVSVESKSLGASVLMLFIMLFTTIACIALFGWRLNVALGGVCFVLYCVFLTVALMFEYWIDAPF